MLFTLYTRCSHDGFACVSSSRTDSLEQWNHFLGLSHLQRKHVTVTVHTSCLSTPPTHWVLSALLIRRNIQQLSTIMPSNVYYSLCLRMTVTPNDNCLLVSFTFCQLLGKFD